MCVYLDTKCQVCSIIITNFIQGGDRGGAGVWQITPSPTTLQNKTTNNPTQISVNLTNIFSTGEPMWKNFGKTKTT